jgi:vacuole morphology and inheritance protein 14
MNNSLQLVDIQLDFNVNDLFQKLYEKIRANHPSIKILIVSWITFLNNIPEVKIINVFNEFLPGLFNMLSDKSKDVNQSADKCLNDFLKEVDNKFEAIPLDVTNRLLEIIIDQTRANHDSVRIHSFEWIYKFLQKYLIILTNYFRTDIALSMNVSPKKTQSNINSARKFTLDEQPGPYYKLSISDNVVNKYKDELITKIPFHLFHKILDVILLNVNNQNEQILSLVISCNTVLIGMVEYFSESEDLNVKNFEEVIKNYFDSKKEFSINIIINWIVKLFRKFHDEMFTNIEAFIQSFANLLGDSNDNVFNSILDILCEVSKYKEEYIELILRKILEKLSVNKSFLNSKGLIILKKLCSVLAVERVYLEFADVLAKMKDIEFIGNMINILDIFLLTYKETEFLRTNLKGIRGTKDVEKKQFFEKLFTTWSLNPVSVLILCLVSEYFELSYHLILKL